MRGDPGPWKDRRFRAALGLGLVVLGLVLVMLPPPYCGLPPIPPGAETPPCATPGSLIVAIIGYSAAVVLILGGGVLFFDALRTRTPT